MEWFTDRQWMKKKINSDGYYNMKYCENLNLFLDFAYSNETAVDRRVTKHGRIVYEIKCPCFKCQNVFYSSREKVHKHLLKNGFMDNYTTWHAHGETSIHEVGQSSNTMEVDADADDDYDNGYRRMVQQMKDKIVRLEEEKEIERLEKEKERAEKLAMMEQIEENTVTNAQMKHQIEFLLKNIPKNSSAS
ncbi:hypothetical protein QVD17_40065 [Tagetes erecta]|uniref:Transposase-associated domain-containing protein n=1 Tax=Tagetes erecta TaxID=13708 RepID=A0AAD8JPL8_TARER|nr:hypothetical protein QVD17_40065 [Tagetes erecta]